MSERVTAALAEMLAQLHELKRHHEELKAELLDWEMGFAELASGGPAQVRLHSSYRRELRGRREHLAAFETDIATFLRRAKLPAKLRVERHAGRETARMTQSRLSRSFGRAMEAIVPLVELSLQRIGREDLPLGDGQHLAAALFTSQAVDAAREVSPSEAPRFSLAGAPDRVRASFRDLMDHPDVRAAALREADVPGARESSQWSSVWFAAASVLHVAGVPKSAKTIYDHYRSAKKLRGELGDPEE